MVKSVNRVFKLPELLESILFRIRMPSKSSSHTLSAHVDILFAQRIDIQWLVISKVHSAACYVCTGCRDLINPAIPLALPLQSPFPGI